MKIIDRQYVESHKDEIIEAIQSGKIFIYPTDTIYGIGVNARLEEGVKKIREIKNRDTKPFSVIAPNKGWIIENFEVLPEVVDKYLPGPYTLIVKSRGKVVGESVNPNDDTLGIRIPDHWFASVVAGAQVPFVTTSVNFSGQSYMKKIEDVPKEILNQVDYIIYEGEIDREPSTKINLV